MKKMEDSQLLFFNKRMTVLTEVTISAFRKNKKQTLPLSSSSTIFDSSAVINSTNLVLCHPQTISFLNAHYLIPKRNSKVLPQALPHRQN